MYKWIWPGTLADGENNKPFYDKRQHAYSEGEVYPAEGIEIDGSHIKYLLGANPSKNVYIEEVKDPKPRKKREPKDTEE